MNPAVSRTKAQADALRSALETVLPYWPSSGYGIARAKHILRVLETKPVYPSMVSRYVNELAELGFPFEGDAK